MEVVFISSKAKGAPNSKAPKYWNSMVNNPHPNPNIYFPAFVFGAVTGSVAMKKPANNTIPAKHSYSTEAAGELESLGKR